MLSVVVFIAGLLIGGLVCRSTLPMALVLHVALLDEPVESGVDDKLGVPPVEPSGQPGLEQLLNTVGCRLLVVALQS